MGEGTTTVQTQKRILAAAQHLLGRGVEACTMRAVAGAAEITPATIYRHFGSKDALVLKVLGIALERFERHLLDAIISLPVGSFLRIAALGQAYLEFARDHEQEFRVLFMPADGKRRRLADLAGRAGYPILRRCISEAMDAGQLRQEDPDMVALYVWTRVHGIAALFATCDFEGETGSIAATDSLAFFGQTRHLVVDGLRPCPTPAAAREGDQS